MTRSDVGWAFATGVAVLVIQFLFMPSKILPGDPWAPRVEADIWLRHSRWGLTPEDLSAHPGLGPQYFVIHKAKNFFFSKYGVLNTLLSAPPLWVAHAVREDLPPALDDPVVLWCLNIYHSLWSALLAGILFLFARRWATPAVAVAYVGASLYTGFLWFYTRAQSSELWQVTIFSALALVLSRGPERSQQTPAGPACWAALAMGLSGALLFLRFTYGLLLPLVASYVFLRARGPARRYVGAVAVTALLVLLGLWMGLNQFRFGHVLETGYSHWRETGGTPDRFEAAVFPRALWGFLFSSQRSVFFHFPLAALALFGAREFFLREKPLALLLGSVGVLFLLGFSFTAIWEGHAAYGPRYLLFFLPAASVPVVLVWQRRRSGIGRVAGGAAAALLAGSLWLQTQVNALPFFLPYRLSGPFAQYGDARINSYFARRPYAFIDWDVRRFVEKGAAFPPLERLKEKRGSAPDGEAAFVAGRVRALAERNYFFGSQRGADASLGESR
ncbi:MAG: hypothetical protein IPN65_00345 [Elusimicrobia bacterium]|jgi:hypothetical protein|nr:hypothetical protein [Elusimicrobiota bacterium]MBK7207314.1 hypothetical protein [Elusimicrobiota bacterium]MBK7546127.1 hypothetical protein [Elusimicrobiota bacterium]MBK7575475.1 hypothetical protein [Elusimicrobiota bacterium]MBK7689185.1 hypothetical protein [Elusimicrobiota bacterium]